MGQRGGLFSKKVRKITFTKHPPCIRHFERFFPYVNLIIIKLVSSAPFTMRTVRFGEVEQHVENHRIYQGPSQYYSLDVAETPFPPLGTLGGVVVPLTVSGQ